MSEKKRNNKIIIGYAIRAIIIIIAFTISLYYSIDPIYFWVILIASISIILNFFQYSTIRVLQKENLNLLKAIVDIRGKNGNK